MANGLIFKKLLFYNWNNLNFIILLLANSIRLSFDGIPFARAQ